MKWTHLLKIKTKTNLIFLTVQKVMRIKNINNKLKCLKFLLITSKPLKSSKSNPILNKMHKINEINYLKRAIRNKKFLHRLFFLNLPKIKKKRINNKITISNHLLNYEDQKEKDKYHQQREDQNRINNQSLMTLKFRWINNASLEWSNLKKFTKHQVIYKLKTLNDILTLKNNSKVYYNKITYQL